MAKKEKLPIDFILDKFVEKLKKEGKKSANQYRQVKNAFEVEDAFASATNAENNFLELLPKLFPIEKYKDKDVEVIIAEIIEGIEKKCLSPYPWNKNGLKSYRTYLGAFLEFVKQIDTVTKDAILQACNENNFDLTLSSLDEKILSGDDERIYGRVKLIGAFKSRLNRQERVSGDKIWLPLDFIRRVFKSKRKVDIYWEWIGELAKSVYIHYDDNCNHVRKVCIGEEDVSLVLRMTAQNLYEVLLVKNEGGERKEYRVLTPTGRGNEKEYLLVSNADDLGEIAIDHVKPIDKSLRDLVNLKMLEIVSEEFKKLKKRGLGNDKKAKDIAAEEIKEKISLETLREELDRIGEDSPLRIMASKYNSQKGNAETFREIWKIKKNEKEMEYWGIMEEKGIYYDDQELFLYQELKDEFPQVTNFKVASISQKEIKKRKVTDKQLKDILNRI